MITLNKETLAAASLPISTANDIRRMIETASDHPAASTGQILAFKFLKSLDGNGTINMGELLYHFEADWLCACIKAKTAGYKMKDFYKVVKG